MQRASCTKCHARFLAASTTKSCPGCGRKGTLTGLDIQGVPSAMAMGPAAGLALVGTRRTRRPLAKAAGITSIVTAGLALLSGLLSLVMLLLFLRIGGTPPAVFLWVLLLLVGGAAGLAGGIMVLQGRGIGRMLGIGGSLAVLGSVGAAAMEPIVLFMGFFFSVLLVPLAWVGALGSIIMLIIPEQPVTEDSISIGIAPLGH